MTDDLFPEVAGERTPNEALAIALQEDYCNLLRRQKGLENAGLPKVAEHVAAASNEIAEAIQKLGQQVKPCPDNAQSTT